MKGGNFAMFNPVKIVKPGQKILTKESNKFVKTYFKQYITNEMFPVSILDDSPVPELCVAAECKLDPEILDLLQSHQIKPVQKLDGNLMTINRRLVKSVGLLSKIWHLLVKARGTASDENPSIIVNKVIKQTVVCGGQPRVPNCGLSMSFEHALAFHQKPPKFKDILVCNDALLKDNYGDLFGSAFHTQLSKRARTTKQLMEANVALQGSPPKKLT